MKRLVAAFVAAAAAAGYVVESASRSIADGQQVPSGATIYTSNANASSATALDADTIARVTADITTGADPESVSVAHNGLRVYTGNASAGSLTVIDSTTNAPVTTVALGATVSVGGGVIIADIVVSPDDALVYSVLAPVAVPVKSPRAGSALNAAVSVFDTTTLTETRTFQLPTASGNDVLPKAIDVSQDGAALFVLVASNPGPGEVVQKISTTNGASLGSVTVSPFARELKVSADGSTVTIVGDDAPQFLLTSTLAPVVGTTPFDIGSQLDLAVAGANVYVLNANFAIAPPPVLKLDGSPRGVIVQPTGPTIDVYLAASGSYVKSIELGAGSNVLGIAVASDGSRAFVSRDEYGYGDGSVTCVQLGNGTIGLTGATGSSPRRVAVKEVEPETPIVSYFLPKNVNLMLKGAGKDSLIAAGFYDDGGPHPDYTQPVTITVGSFTKTFTLLPKGKGYFSPKDPVVKFFILPNLRGSSRGRFKMILSKTTLAGLIDPNAAVPFHFTASGLPDAQGSVLLTAGRYKLGKKRGALVLPQFFPQKATAKVGGPNADTLAFKGGFATKGTTPAALTAVRFGFGPVFVRTILGSQFTKKGDTFTFKSMQGSTTFSVKLDFLRETVSVAGKKIELGNLDTGTIKIVLDAGNGDGAFGNTVRIATKNTSRFY